MTNNYYQNHKERPTPPKKKTKKARERYQNISEEKKTKGEKDKWRKKVRNRHENLFEEEKKKWQNHCERNKNFSNEQKQKQVEYMRNCYLTHQK